MYNKHLARHLIIVFLVFLYLIPGGRSSFCWVLDRQYFSPDWIGIGSDMMVMISAPISIENHILVTSSNTIPQVQINAKIGGRECPMAFQERFLRPNKIKLQNFKNVEHALYQELALQNTSPHRRNSV
jgi:hypothetical protein